MTQIEGKRWHDMGGQEDDQEAEEEAPSADPPAKPVRGKKKKTAEPEPADEEPEEAERAEEAEQEEAESLPTFARRYCPSRPLFKAKWMGIREAFQVRIRPFVKSPCKLEDSPT